MVDIKVKEKHRNKVNKLVQLKMKETGMTDEKLARKEVNKELRRKKKESKAVNPDEIQAIKDNIKKTLAGSTEKVINKAISKAIAKYYSQLKKSRKPQIILKQKADALIKDVNSQLWCPSNQGWWDDECQKKFEEVELLAAMWEIDLLKAPQNFGKLYPEICKKYFDFLAKKRFNSTKESEVKDTADKVKKCKSSLQRKFEERKAQNVDSKKTDKDILNEVLEELNELERKTNLKNLKKFWKPTHKPFFDKECQDACEKLFDQATKMGFDLDTKVVDFKKFKIKNKEECKKYFKLLETKRIEFNTKQKVKLEKQKDDSIEDELSTKDIKLDNSGKIETEAEVDETISQVERELKKERRKKAKLAKKLRKKEEKDSEAVSEESKFDDSVGLDTMEATNIDESMNLETTDETPIKKHKEKKCKKNKENTFESEETNCQLEENSKEKKKKKKLAKKMTSAEEDNEKSEGKLEITTNDGHIGEEEDKVMEDVETDALQKSVKKKRKKEVKSEADVGSAKKSKKK